MGLAAPGWATNSQPGIDAPSNQGQVSPGSHHQGVAARRGGIGAGIALTLAVEPPRVLVLVPTV
jgi:hypothetical protein